MRHDIEAPMNRSRAAMAHGAAAQMDARARRDDADAELDRLEAAITAAGSHELHAVASAYHQATRSRLPARPTLAALRTQHAMVQQAWEAADYDMQHGDAA